MYNRVASWGYMFSILLSCTGLTFGTPIANAQLTRSSVIQSVIRTPLPRLTVDEVPCSTFLKPYFDWISVSYRNYLVATVAFNKVEDGLVTYSTGELRQNGNYLTGSLTQLLSNRFTYLSGSNPGGFSFSSPTTQPFSINEPTSVSVTLATDGSVTWVERSFNNKLTSNNYSSVCYSNDTAILVSPFFKGTGVITFRKASEPVIN